MTKSGMKDKSNPSVRFSQATEEKPQKVRRTARDLPPGTPAYILREFDREPDERIAALESEQDQLMRSFWDCSKTHNPELGKLREQIETCARRLAELMKAPDRICRLLQLRHHRPDFAEWLAEQKRQAPMILRYGVPVRPEEQDGYYQRDYEDWKRIGQAGTDGTGSRRKRFEAREENGVWTANLSVSVRAKGRTRQEAYDNARLRASDCLREALLENPGSADCPSENSC